MARKQKFNYFDSFVKISEHAVEYSAELVKYFEKNISIVEEGREPSVEKAIQRYEELHSIETESDSVKHEIIERLVVEFQPPIEREDVMLVCDELDDLVDDLDEVLQTMYMYDVHVVNADALELMRIAAKECVVVNEVIKEFRNFKKSDKIHELIVKVNDLETEADSVYIEAMHSTFVAAKDNRDPESWGKARVLTSLEKLCDACEDLTDTIATVCMKNS